MNNLFIVFFIISSQDSLIFANFIREELILREILTLELM